MPEMKVDMSMEVDASAKELWEWMADIPKWPEWKSFVASSSYVSGGDLKTGSVIKFKPNVTPVPINLKAAITESDPGRRLAWEGGFPGLRAVHSFDFEDAGGGRTRIVTREKFSGIGVLFFRIFFPQKKLEELHKLWLEAFRDRAAKK